MRVHLIVDFMFLYYKYMNTIKSGRIKRLTAEIPMQGETGGLETQLFDISNIYYTVKEIEGFRRTFEREGNDVTLSVCFDAPSPERKDKDAEYKSNRAASRLESDDFSQINIIRELLTEAGHNVYWKEATEADDLINNLVASYKDLFDFTVIYTPDTDILVNINSNVGVQRYKAKKGYTAVSKVNYEAYCMQEFGCTIKYNGILLYKSLCGDKSDKVAGIKGFGPAAYEKFISAMGDKIDWNQLTNPVYIEKILEESNYFKEEALKQAIHSLGMVKPYIFDINEPKYKSTVEKRKAAYLPMQMASLVD